MGRDFEKEFTEELFKMQDGELGTLNFFGVAQLLSVEILDDNRKDMRDVVDIVVDILNQFSSLSNRKKKEILKLCKDGNRFAKTSQKKLKKRGD